MRRPSTPVAATATPRRLVKAVRATVRALACASVPVVLASCGGSDGGSDCSLNAQKADLAGYMDDWYFWYRQAPHPTAASFADIDSYFAALLYTGTDPAFPADRWSRSESDESFFRFYGAGASLGYGLAVNAIEVAGAPASPLFVRHVEARSDAAAKGVRRGDQVISANGVTAASMITTNDFGPLTASRSGERLTLVLRNGGAERTVVLVASVFSLTPVSGTSVIASTGGRKIGYLMVKDMLDQAEAPLDAAFTTFRSQGVQDVVLDLRYNGAGFVSVGRLVASYLAGAAVSGQVYATLKFNDKRAAFNDSSFVFRSLTQAVGLPRAYVLTGPRTCAAAEQVVNGLRGVGVSVVTIGATTCGKPVGSQPVSDGCGTTYSVVNFETVNALNQGRYFTGLAATCAVAEDYSRPLGDPADPLLVAAARHADSGSCGAAVLSAPVRAQALGVGARARVVLDERADMLPR